MDLERKCNALMALPPALALGGYGLAFLLGSLDILVLVGSLGMLAWPVYILCCARWYTKRDGYVPWGRALGSGFSAMILPGLAVFLLCLLAPDSSDRGAAFAQIFLLFFGIFAPVIPYLFLVLGLGILACLNSRKWLPQ